MTIKTDSRVHSNLLCHVFYSAMLHSFGMEFVLPSTCLACVFCCVMWSLSIRDLNPVGQSLSSWQGPDLKQMLKNSSYTFVLNVMTCAAVPCLEPPPSTMCASKGNLIVCSANYFLVFFCLYN